MVGQILAIASLAALAFSIGVLWQWRRPIIVPKFGPGLIISELVALVGRLVAEKNVRIIVEDESK